MSKLKNGIWKKIKERKLPKENLNKSMLQNEKNTVEII